MSLTRVLGQYTPMPAVIFPGSRAASLGTGISQSGGAAPSQQNWRAANLGLFYPFNVTEPTVFLKLWWMNGSNITGNVDIGLYRSDFSKVYSSGAAARAGSTDTIESHTPSGGLSVPVGSYYFAMSCSSSSGNFRTYNYTGRFLAVGGWLEQTSVGTLPSPATPVSISATTAVPLFGGSLITTGF